MTDKSPRPLQRGPVAAVIAVVPRAGHVLLARRANPPDAGLWGFPGGKIEHGESVTDAAVRELREETGVLAEAVRAFNVLDAFDRDAAGGLRRHFILVAVLCRWISGAPVAADDALEARWFRLDDLDDPDLPLSADVADVARQAVAIAGNA